MLRENENYNDEQHQFNIQRRMMERDFGNNDKDKYKNDFVPFTRFDDQLKNIGEITGEKLNGENLEKGMPFRPTMSISSDRYAFEPNDKTNSHLDFDLYDAKSNINVSYYDPNTIQRNSIGYSNITEAQKILNRQSHTNNETLLSDVINVFTLDFLLKFSEHIKSKKSIILSPFSILQTFCLLYLGSKNTTEKELRDYFSLPDKITTFNGLYKLNNAMANSNVFTKMNLICVPNYITVSDAYLSYINNLGSILKFDPKNPNYEANRINNLISKSTNGTFKSIIQPSMLDPQAILTLINTIYFYSKWKYPFNPAYTKREEFYGISKQVVNMMSQSNTSHRYFEDNINQVLEMDYSDGKFSMGIILPKSQYREAIISNEQFSYYISQLKEKEIELIKIPKFKHETSYRIDNLFKKYGMKQVFTNADVSDIIPSNNNMPVFITNIIHACVIVVNESGTKASSVTAMMMTNSYDPSKKIKFIANHQFLYYIRYKPYNTLIFIGQHY